MKLTIKNNYHGETRTINSTCPRYIKQVRESMRRGDGDFVKIIDEKGQTYDATDFGRGLELVNIATGTVVLQLTPIHQTDKYQFRKPTQSGEQNKKLLSLDFDKLKE